MTRLKWKAHPVDPESPPAWFDDYRPALNTSEDERRKYAAWNERGNRRTRNIIGWLLVTILTVLLALIGLVIYALTT